MFSDPAFRTRDDGSAFSDYAVTRRRDEECVWDHVIWKRLLRM